MKEKIQFIPVLDAADFSTEIEDELAKYDYSTHYQNEIVGIDFDGTFPQLEKYLVETYGEEVKNYTRFAIEAT